MTDWTIIWGLTIGIPVVWIVGSFWWVYRSKGRQEESEQAKLISLWQ